MTHDDHIREKAQSLVDRVHVTRVELERAARTLLDCANVVAEMRADLSERSVVEKALPNRAALVTCAATILQATALLEASKS